MKDDRLVAMRVFLTVVETGGFTAAARSLGVSQPFVSQTVQRLEARLRTKLLHRTTRGHRLTAEGERFVEGCRSAIDAVESAEAQLQTDAGQVGGLLRVSAPLAFGLDRITPLLPMFLDCHPNLTLELLLTDDSVNLVEQGIDVAIRMGQLADSTMCSRRLCGLNRIVVAAPALIERYGRPETPEDLRTFPVLSWTGAREQLNRWTFRTADGEQSFVADGRFRSDGGMALFQMCLAGFGAMRCAEHLAQPAIRSGELVSLLDEYEILGDSAFYAVFLPDRNILPRIRIFLDFMIETFREPEW